MRFTGFVACLCLLPGLCDTAAADLVTFTFDGVISQIDDGAAPLDDVGGITVGSTYTAYFQYETNGAVDVDIDPNRGLYLLNLTGPASFFTMTVNGLTFTVGPGGVDLRNDIPSDLSPTTDFFNYTGGGVDVLPAGWSTTAPAASALQAVFLETSGRLFTNDAIPTSFNPADYDVGVLLLSFSNLTFPGGTEGNVTITGTINLQGVPEPSSLAFASVAAGGGLLLRRRRMRSKTGSSANTSG